MTRYRGRFAPSPTGQLHIGSLTSAVASYLDAKANQGKWLVRMEDLDPPREVPGAAQAILNSLKNHGLNWDEPIIWQSQRHTAYQASVDNLLASGHAFYCHCSRTELKNNSGIHQSVCRKDPSIALSDCAIRLKATPDIISFNDGIQGSFSQQLNTDVGDFVLKRKDGLFAYQLAVTVDDAYQAITHCVRGSDLLDSTPRQIYLQRFLQPQTIEYSHIPIIINQQKQKLSKQNHAQELNDDECCDNLLTALRYLNQPLPNSDLRRNTSDILNWATTHWSQERIPKTVSIIENTL